MKKPLKILLYGPTGSGKDTHSEVISATFGIPAFSAGGLMREEIQKKTAIGLEIAQYVARGEIAPGNVATELLKARIQEEAKKKGYVLNGYPRTVESVGTYLSYDRPTHVIHLLLSDNGVRERLKVRGRQDDASEAVETRIRRYHEVEKPACDLWKDQPGVHYGEISTDAPIEEVSRRVVEFIRSHA
ncbi:MAG: nucleoside monophosphate kinase [Patescibacteria group bacterium]